MSEGQPKPYIQNPDRGCYARITPLQTIEEDGEWSTAFRLSCERSECPLRDWRLVNGSGDAARTAEEQLKRNTSSLIEANCLVMAYNQDDSGQTLLEGAIELKQRRDAEETH